jgi:hypothetical protein
MPYTHLLYMTDSPAHEEICSECGMRSRVGQPNCSALRDNLSARDFEQPVPYWKYHRLAVDAYCVQHSSYVASSKSLAAHLCGLCVALEQNNDPNKLKQLQLWLSTNPKLPKPVLPHFRGNLTIVDVSGIRDAVSYGLAVEAWARLGSIQNLATNRSGVASDRIMRKLSTWTINADLVSLNSSLERPGKWTRTYRDLVEELIFEGLLLAMC